MVNKSTIETFLTDYLRDDNLLPDFSRILKIEPSAKEIVDYKEFAKRFRKSFNAINATIKSEAFKKKLESCKLGTIIEKKFHVNINKLKNVLDYTGTVDYRIPRKFKIKHGVLCLIFPKKSIFLKESIRNDYEKKYDYYSKILGMPKISLCLIPISKEKQYILSQGIKNAIALKDAKNKTINIGCLAEHSALADFLKKGGRDFSNYLVYKDKIYAIDNEFLFNKKNIRKKEMNKKYNELYVLEQEKTQKNNLIDNLIIFNKNYHKACNILHYNNLCLKNNIKDFIRLSPLFNQFNKKDRKNILEILDISDFSQNEEKLLSIINSSSAFLRKIIRQSSEITAQIFSYNPKPFPSVNFDHKTFVLKKTLVKEIGRSNEILEIGPGCNATLSLFLKKNYPKACQEFVMSGA